MRKLILAATALVLSTTATAQSAQERLDERYDRALAAGYKALMLCGAIGNAERFGAKRSEQSVLEWELSGIQAPLNDIVPELKHELVRQNGRLIRVEVQWDDALPPRIAVSKNTRDRRGCSITPIGTSIAEANLLTPERNSNRTGRTYEAPVFGPSVDYENPSSTMAAIASKGFSGGYGEGSRTTALIVVRNEETQLEQYAHGFGPSTPQRTWSVAKSIAATFIGAAVYQGALDVHEIVGLGESNEDIRRSITVDHALRMASGRYSDTPGNRTDPLYWGGGTIDETMSNWPIIHSPGSVFRYANNDTLAASQRLPKLGQRGLPFPLAVLQSMGLRQTVPETDWQGDFVLSSQVWATARDLARLGQLYLNNGVWNGERLIAANWRAYVSDPNGPQPEGTNWGYGAGWWTFRRPEGNAFEGIPDDAFAARGNRGQYVVVVPSRNVVIVRRGEDMVGTRFDIAAFTRDVLAALEE